MREGTWRRQFSRRFVEIGVSSGFPTEAFGNDGLLEGLEIAFIT